MLCFVTSAVSNAGEPVVLLALAIILPLGALMLGLCRGRGWKAEGRGRVMSFESAFMSVGAWPTDVGMAAPIITACLYFDEAPEQMALEEASKKMLKYHNFRALPQRCPRRWRWPFPYVSTRLEWRDIEVRPADPISRVQANGSTEVLLEMERVKDCPLRHTTVDGTELPLWNLHVIENTGNTYGGIGSVVVVRVHHTIGDGMSLVAAARSVMEGVDGSELALWGAGVGAALAKGCRAGQRRAKRFSMGQILAGIRDVVALSMSDSDTALPFGHHEAPISRGGASDGFPAGNGKSRGSFSGRRRIVLFPDIPLSLVKNIKDAANVTVNDVVMSLVSGCIRRYCEAEGGGDFLGGKGCRSRALIPVALPRSVSQDDAAILCNRWVFVSMGLSIDAGDPVSRLEKIGATTLAMKQSPTPELQRLTQSALMPHLPLAVCREMSHRAMATHTVAVSNVPGPQQPVAFAKKRLKRVHFVFNNIMPQVGVVSLDGILGINFVVDPVSVPRCTNLPSLFLAELAELADKLGVDASAELDVAEEELARLTKVMESVHSSCSLHGGSE